MREERPSANKVLRVLIIEDDLADVVMINSELRRGGLSFRSKRVETKDNFLEEIRSNPPDLILADHGLPTFDSFTALAISQNECPQVPFIFVSGGMGEEMVIKTLKGGATDYVLKDHLDHLVPAIKRALHQAEERVKNRLMDEALREREQQFRTLIDGVKDYAIFMLDAEGRITSWNAGAEWIENYRAEEILGRPISCLFLDSDIAARKPEEALKAAVTEGRFEEEGWHIRKSGARFWAKLVLTPLRDSRSLSGFAVVMQDLSQQHETEEMWKAYEAIINTAKDFLTLIDFECRYVAANDAYCRAHGKTRDEIIGATVSEIWGEQVFQQLIRENLMRCFTGQDVRYQAWFSFSTLGRRFFEVNYYPYSQEGIVTHAIVVTHDITQLEQAQRTAQALNENLEQRVNERTEELKTAYQEMETLGYSISHDLRAPLRHIHGFVEILRQEGVEQLSPKGREHLVTISESAERMGRLIDGLLAFFQIGRLKPQPAQIDLKELIDSIRQELREQYQGRNIEWVLPDLPPLQADPFLLRQVLLELISNALKFTRSRRQARLEIHGTTGAKETIVSIRDNGIGFDMQYAHQLFGVFQKLHSPQQFEGTGIGLAKARRIIQRHGGRVWAEGAVDKGATFYFALPHPQPN